MTEEDMLMENAKPPDRQRIELLAALEIANLLEPFDRETQTRILRNVAVFCQRQDDLSKNEKPPV